MKLFYINRKVDNSGLSGTGKVCEGVIFDNDKVVMMWLSENKSIVLHDNIENVYLIHCSNGLSEIVYYD